MVATRQLTGEVADVAAAIGVAAGVFIFGALLFRSGTMGGGDVKLMTVIALWAGPNEILPFLLVTALGGGIMALLMTSSARFALAQTFDLFGSDSTRERVLGIHVSLWRGHRPRCLRGSGAELAPIRLARISHQTPSQRRV